MARLDLARGPTAGFGSVAAAARELAAGRMVLLEDDRGSSEGDLLIAADFADAAAINFMAREGRSLIFLALSYERCGQLGLEPIDPRGDAQLGGLSTISIEARSGISTGISAADRARTIQVAVDRTAGAADLVSPGHVFPLRAAAGGILARPARVEAAVELAAAAGSQPAAVLCPLMREDGFMARGEDLTAIAARHDLVVVTVSAVAEHRVRASREVRQLVA